MTQDNAATTVLSLITNAIEEHNKTLVNHQRHLERLSREVAIISNRLKDFEIAGSSNSNDAKFLADVSERLKAISTTLDAT